LELTQLRPQRTASIAAMASINQNMHQDALPDFRNLGVILRVVLIVLLLAGLAALCQASAWGLLFERFLQIVAPVQPALVLSLVVLWALGPWLRRLDYAAGIAMVLLVELLVVSVVFRIGEEVFRGDLYGTLERYWLFTAATTGLLLYYFHLRSRALSPALTEARLQALQARIRPHFLFNSINAVLSLIRQDPRRAERALEDLADLYRVLMADNRQLTRIEGEIDLAKRYLSIEQLRLGERLLVAWDTAGVPLDALIPQMLLQPLLENAVYHGIEPRSEPGTIHIRIHRQGDQVHILLRNPYRQEQERHGGSRMALANIRERLALHFDAEASIKTTATDQSYQVHIVIPYLKGGA
jgi:two-component system sensor histidine kinase AlgZ